MAALIYLYLIFSTGGTARTLGTPKQLRDLQTLKDRICAGLETVTPEMLSRVSDLAEYRIVICRATKVANIEIY